LKNENNVSKNVELEDEELDSKLIDASYSDEAFNIKYE
jgi:hypothetical protein